MRQPDSAARWLGTSAALLTVALSVGAHALADDASPSGSGIALLVVLAAAVGAISAERVHGATGLIALLAAGQVLGHLVLAAAGHPHGAGAAPSPAMVGTHATAVVVGAVLIAAAARLCRVLSTVVRTLTAPVSHPNQTGAAAAAPSDQPLQSMLQLAASVPLRGPPVAYAP